MKRWLYLAGLIVALISLAACSAENQPAAPVDVEGPALIMFYTDN